MATRKKPTVRVIHWTNSRMHLTLDRKTTLCELDNRKPKNIVSDLCLPIPANFKDQMCTTCERIYNVGRYPEHLYVPETKPVSELMYADTAEVAAALRTMVDKSADDNYVTIHKVVLEKLVEALELEVRNAA